MSELEEHDCECCSKITKAIMNTQALLWYVEGKEADSETTKSWHPP
jgi:hypothetical protein